MIHECGAVGEVRIGGANWSTWRKPTTVRKETLNKSYTTPYVYLTWENGTWPLVSSGAGGDVTVSSQVKVITVCHWLVPKWRRSAILICAGYPESIKQFQKWNMLIGRYHLHMRHPFNALYSNMNMCAHQLCHICLLATTWELLKRFSLDLLMDSFESQ
jgi:hypothetical protein